MSLIWKGPWYEKEARRVKPYEYYNYPRKNKRFWWLPLPLVLLLVVVTYIGRSCGADTPKETWATGPSQVRPGLVEQGWHTVLAGGRLYNVLDEDYRGEYELRRVYFVCEPWTDNMDGELLIPVDRAAAVPEDFPREAVLDRAEYEAFCRAWGLTPAFPEHGGRFALVARGRAGSVLTVFANQTRRAMGLDDPKGYDAREVIETAVDALRLLIRRDREGQAHG